MVKKRRRHTTAHKLWVALERLIGNKTITLCLDYRTPAEEHFVLCSEPDASA